MSSGVEARLSVSATYSARTLTLFRILPRLLDIRLCLQCVVYMIIWLRDTRRRTGKITIVRWTKVPGGHLITLQALFVYTVSILLTSKLSIHLALDNELLMIVILIS